MCPVTYKIVSTFHKNITLSQDMASDGPSHNTQLHIFPKIFPPLQLQDRCLFLPQNPDTWLKSFTSLSKSLKLHGRGSVVVQDVRFNGGEASNPVVESGHGEPLLGVLGPAGEHDAVHVRRAAVRAAQHPPRCDLRDDLTKEEDAILTRYQG